MMEIRNLLVKVKVQYRIPLCILSSISFEMPEVVPYRVYKVYTLYIPYELPVSLYNTL